MTSRPTAPLSAMTGLRAELAAIEDAGTTKDYLQRDQDAVVGLRWVSRRIAFMYRTLPFVNWPEDEDDIADQVAVTAMQMIAESGMPAAPCVARWERQLFVSTMESIRRWAGVDGSPMYVHSIDPVLLQADLASFRAFGCQIQATARARSSSESSGTANENWV